MNSMSIKLPIRSAPDPEALIRGCRDNRLESQEQLYRFCYPAMMKICQRYTADLDAAGSIFNDAMLRVFKHIRTYKDEGKPMAWIKTIVVNCCLDAVKKQNKFRDHYPEHNTEIEIEIPPEVLNRVAAKEIRQFINGLPKATATVFNLYVYEGYTHLQIAQSLGISAGTSKWHLSEGKRLLKEKLGEFFNPRNDNHESSK